MLSRVGGYLLPRAAATAPAASGQLERQGYAVLRGVLGAAELRSAGDEIAALYDAQPPDRRARVQDEDFRYMAAAAGTSTPGPTFRGRLARPGRRPSPIRCSPSVRTSFWRTAISNPARPR